MGPKIVAEAWAAVISKPGKPSAVERHEDPDLSGKLEKISKSWDSQQPDSELSIMTAKGEIVYVGRYEDGVVLRLSENPHKTVFLTKDMAERFGKKLVGKT